MIASPRLLQPAQVLVQRLLRLERRPVHALEHLPPLVAAPVRPGDAQQLERGYLPRRLDVWPGAQVLELAVAVGGDRVAFRDLADYLQLHRLAGVHLQRLVPRVLLELETEVPRYDAPHALFDALQVVVEEGLRGVEVVVEAVIRRRAYRKTAYPGTSWLPHPP